MGGFRWVREVAEKYMPLDFPRYEKEKQIDKLGMACMVLYNAWCHGLRKGVLHSIDSVKTVVDYSDIIDEQTLTRYSTNIDEMNYKDNITQKYIHGYDADISPYPHAAVARVIKKRKRKFDDPETEEMTALQCFRGSNRDNIVRDYAIDFVTKMYEIHMKAGLPDDELKEIETRYRQKKIRSRELADKRREKRREKRRLDYEEFAKKYPGSVRTMSGK